MCMLHETHCSPLVDTKTHFNISCYDNPFLWDHSHQQEITSISAWMNSYTQYKVWIESIYPFPNGTTVEIWGWMSNFIPYFIGHLTMSLHIFTKNKVLAYARKIVLLPREWLKSSINFALRVNFCTSPRNVTLNFLGKTLEWWSM